MKVAIAVMIVLAIAVNVVAYFAEKSMKKKISKIAKNKE